MIHNLRGSILDVVENFAVISMAGVGLKVFMSSRVLAGLVPGAEIEVFCHLHVREDLLDLYGFNTQEERDFFELLLGVAGVGPRSALAVLDVADLGELKAAIQEGRPDLMTRAAGIGRKTAERIVLDLKGKIKEEDAAETVRKMEGDSDVVEALVGLGYRRGQAREAIDKIDSEIVGLEARLKEALKILSSHKK